MKTWTVLGIWDGDNPVSAGAVLGEHEVVGGDDAGLADAVTDFAGMWATQVELADDATPADVDAAAVALMRQEAVTFA